MDGARLVGWWIGEASAPTILVFQLFMRDKEFSLAHAA
jgi:hypothetical protein